MSSAGESPTSSSSVTPSVAPRRCMRCCAAPADLHARAEGAAVLRDRPARSLPAARRWAAADGARGVSLAVFARKRTATRGRGVLVISRGLGSPPQTSRTCSRRRASSRSCASRRASCALFTCSCCRITSSPRRICARHCRSRMPGVRANAYRDAPPVRRRCCIQSECATWSNCVATKRCLRRSRCWC